MTKNQRRNERAQLKKINYEPKPIPRAPKKNQNRGNLIFRVKWAAEICGEKREGIEEEASWFLIDQQGKLYSYGPLKPVTPCCHYESVEPLIKIGEEYLSVEEIERRLGVGDEKEGQDPPPADYVPGGKRDESL